MSQYLSELKRRPDVIALTETKLKDNICGNIELPGSKFIHVNSPTLAGGVGFISMKNQSILSSEN